MSEIKESRQEDKGFRKRANMLSDIQAMIMDYKKKSTYSNLVSGADEESAAKHQPKSIKA